jgi:hypothetical protein
VTDDRDIDDAEPVDARAERRFAEVLVWACEDADCPRCRGTGRLANRKRTMCPECLDRQRRRHPQKNADMISTFADDTASKTGVTPRTVREEVQIAKPIAPEVRDAIRNTPMADSKADLLKLARMPVP